MRFLALNGHSGCLCGEQERGTSMEEKCPVRKLAQSSRCKLMVALTKLVAVGMEDLLNYNLLVNSMLK